MLLVAGCSFLHNPHLTPLMFGTAAFDSRQVRNVSQSGAGNYYISQSIIENLDSHVDRVFVLFSGLSRIDIPLPRDLAFEVERFAHHVHLGRSVWFLSGGAAGFWNMDTAHSPDWIRTFLKKQYISHDWEYLANLSLSKVAGCLSLLEQRGINYVWGFTHDIYEDHTHEASFGGAVTRDNRLAYGLPWHRALRTFPYDYCREFGLLSEDDFHPSATGYAAWLDTVRDQVSTVWPNP